MELRPCCQCYLSSIYVGEPASPSVNRAGAIWIFLAVYRTLGESVSRGDRFCVPVGFQRCEMLLLLNEVRLGEYWENDDPIPKCLQEKIVIRLFPIVGRLSVQSIAKNVRQKFPTRQTLQVFYNSKIVWAAIPVGG